MVKSEDKYDTPLENYVFKKCDLKTAFEKSAYTVSGSQERISEIAFFVCVIDSKTLLIDVRLTRGLGRVRSVNFFGNYGLVGSGRKL